MAAWETEELVVLLYYASRQINYGAAADLLAYRGFQRTKAAVRNKLGQIRAANPGLFDLDRDRWNESAVDIWIRQLIPSNDLLELIRVTDNEIRIVEKVRSNSPLATLLCQLKTIASSDHARNALDNPGRHCLVLDW